VLCSAWRALWHGRHGIIYTTRPQKQEPVLARPTQEIGLTVGMLQELASPTRDHCPSVDELGPGDLPDDQRARNASSPPIEGRPRSLPLLLPVPTTMYVQSPPSGPSIETSRRGGPGMRQIDRCPPGPIDHEHTWTYLTTHSQTGILVPGCWLLIAGMLPCRSLTHTRTHARTRCL